MVKEALFYKTLKENKVQCELCPHLCVIPITERGKCHIRENQEGKLYSLIYGKIIAAAVDPIEKKPLFNFMPGTSSYSIATSGCNLRCQFCQNSDISQARDLIIGEEILPSEIVKNAITNNCKSISYTYTEPTIFYELVLDTAKIAKKQGIKNVLVTNGFINPGPLRKIAKYIDAANIDLKSFNEKFYREKCGARLQPVLDSIHLYHALGIFIEITTLIIPNENDSTLELTKIAEFISGIDKNIPWHVSQFHPDYKMRDHDFTPERTLLKAVEIGKKAGLNYIYTGNIPGNDFESTYCPNCKKQLIQRIGFKVVENKIKNKKCPFCNEKIGLVK